MDKAMQHLNNRVRDFLIVQLVLLAMTAFLIGFEMFYLSPKAQSAALDRYKNELAYQLGLITPLSEAKLNQLFSGINSSKNLHSISVKWQGRQWVFQQQNSNTPPTGNSKFIQASGRFYAFAPGDENAATAMGELNLLASVEYRSSHLLGYGVALLAVLASIISALVYNRKFYREVNEIQQLLRNPSDNINNNGKDNVKNNIDILAPLIDDVITLKNTTLMKTKTFSTLPVKHDIDNASVIKLEKQLGESEIENIELSLAKKSAIEANQVKSQIIANTGHELLTPLNSIVGFSQLLLDKNIDNQQQYNFAQRINDNALHLTALVNDLLDFSIKNNRAITLNYQSTDIYALLFSIANTMAYEAQGKGLTLLTAFDTLKDCQIETDPLRLRQVISNLLVNAIRYTEYGHISIAAKFDFDKQDNKALLIDIEDTGIGISNAQRESIFTAFVSHANPASNDHPEDPQRNAPDQNPGLGLGLGLSIVATILHKLGATLELDSELNRGSCFHIRLPVKQSSAPQTKAHWATTDIPTNIHIGSDYQATADNLVKRLQPFGASFSVSDIEGLTRQQSSSNINNENNPTDITVACINRPQLEAINSASGPLYTALVKSTRQWVIYTPIALSLSEQQLLAKPNIKVINGPFYIESLFKRNNNQQSPPSSPESLEAGLSRAAASEHLTGKKTLIVDDNPSNIELLAMLISGCQCEVVSALNGQDALAKARQTAFDWLFLDIRMQPMDGFTLLEQIRQLPQYRSTPIIACTAHTSQQEYRKLLKAGFNKVIYKPVERQQIMALGNSLFGYNDVKNTANNNYSSNDNSTKNTTSNNTIGNNKSNREDSVDSQSDMDNVVIFDLEYALDRASGKPTVAKRIFQMLIEELQQINNELTPSNTATDLNTLIDHVHQLNGAAAMTGARRLKYCLNRCESTLKLIQSERTDSASINTNQQSKIDASLTQVREQIQALLEWSHQHDLDIMFAG